MGERCIHASISGATKRSEYQALIAAGKWTSVRCERTFHVWSQTPTTNIYTDAGVRGGIDNVIDLVAGCSNSPGILLGLHYGPKMGADANGYAWAQLAGFSDTQANWIADTGGVRTNWLAANYNGYSEANSWYSRPPSGGGYAVWSAMANQFNHFMTYACSTWVHKHGTPWHTMEFEFWNEITIGGAGGKGLSGNDYDGLDQWGQDMSNYIVPRLNLNPDGLGKRKLYSSTFLGAYSIPNFFGGSYTTDEVARCKRGVDLWANYAWCQYFDVVFFNHYTWPFLSNQLRDAIGAVEYAKRSTEKLAEIVGHIKSKTGTWMEGKPIAIGEHGARISNLARTASGPGIYSEYQRGLATYLEAKSMAELVNRVYTFTLSDVTVTASNNIGYYYGDGSGSAVSLALIPHLAAAGYTATTSPIGCAYTIDAFAPQSIRNILTGASTGSLLDPS